MKHSLRTIVLPATLAATLILAACGTADTSGMKGMSPSASAAGGASSGTAKNIADVEFATMMIPHHAQAIVMAETALKQATNPKVKALALDIKAAQGPEIKQMSGWLTGWGAPVPGSDSGSDMSAMGGMGDQSGGMMSADEMAQLGKARGPAFDRMWLKMMVRHHQGAIVMAKTALAKGTRPDTQKLARSIVTGQSAEITRMSMILSEIPA